MGTRLAAIADLPNNPDHPYFEFISAISDGLNATLTQKFIAVVNEYYARLGNDTKTKNKMLHAYTRSVQYEFKFAETVFALEVESNPAPTFTDLVDSHIAPDAQAEVVNHALFREIGAGTLPLDRFAVLVQQDHLYINGFYGAFAYMEGKETDKELKRLLHKDSGLMYDYLERLYDKFNFQPAYFAEGYTKGKYFRKIKFLK